MKYSSRDRPILAGNSNAWAKAGPSISAEASRATKKATLEAREGIPMLTLPRPGSFRLFRCLGSPAQEVGDEPEAGRLAFFGVKLRADQIVAADDGGDRAAIVGERQHHVRMGGFQLEGMHEIGMVAGSDAGQQRMRF